MTVKFPLVLSLAVGAGLPTASVPLAAADHEPTAEAGREGKVRSAEAPGAREARPAGEKLAQGPAPATLTLVIVLSPVFCSVATTVTVVFGSTVVPGETLLVVSVVAG